MTVTMDNIMLTIVTVIEHYLDRFKVCRGADSSGRPCYREFKVRIWVIVIILDRHLIEGTLLTISIEVIQGNLSFIRRVRLLDSCGVLI